MTSSSSSANQKKPAEGSVENYLLTTDDCPGCTQVKESLKAQIESGEIQVVTVNTDSDFDFAEKLGIENYPSLVVCEVKDGKKPAIS